MHTVDDDNNNKSYDVLSIYFILCFSHVWGGGEEETEREHSLLLFNLWRFLSHDNQSISGEPDKKTKN